MFCCAQSNKPLMEKRRRERINTCLDQLKAILMDATKKEVVLPATNFLQNTIILLLVRSPRLIYTTAALLRIIGLSLRDVEQ